MAKKPNTQENIKKQNSAYLYNPFEEEISIAEKLEFISNATQEELINIIDQMDYDSSNRRGALSLKSKIKKAVWRVVPAGESDKEIKEADFIQEMWEDFREDFINFYMKGVLYGFNVGAPVYEIVNGRWQLKSFIDLGPKYFAFTDDWKLKNKVQINIGNKIISSDSILPEDIFYVYTYEMEDGNRYGKPLRLRNYYLWLFYRECLQIWSLFNKKATIPSFLALSSANVSTENKETAITISKAMRGIKNGVGGILYNVDSIEKLDANPQGYKSMQEFKKDLKDEMVQNYTGSTLSTETNQVGSSYNVAELHRETSEDFALDIAYTFKEAINEQIRKLIDLNRPEGSNDPYPTIDIFYKETAPIETVLKAGSQGVPMKKDVLIEEYKIPIADENDEKEGNLIYLNNSSSENQINQESNNYNPDKILASFLAESKKKSLI